MSYSTPSFLQPLALETFFSTYWEKQPLHIERSTSSPSPLIDLAMIESVLSSQAVYFPGVQLTQSGTTIDASNYTDNQDVILPLRLFEQHSQGATIVMSQAQKLFESLNALCREVTRSLQMRSQANVYLSPPGNQGFNAHYDTHDVFILQVSGAKTFNFYPSCVELPSHDERFDPDNLDVGAVDESIALTAGDTLYIPRGVVHDAVADDSAASIHVTLGVYPMLMRDMLQESIQLLAEQDSGFRRSVDTCLHASSGSSAEKLKQALLPLIRHLQSSIEDDDTALQVHSRFKDELSLEALQDCKGLASRRLDPYSTEHGTPEFLEIRLRTESVIGYEATPYGVKVRAFGQILEFGEPMSKEIQKLLVNGLLKREDLQALDADQKDAMIRRLLQENLVDLVVKEAGLSCSDGKTRVKR